MPAVHILGHLHTHHRMLTYRCFNLMRHYLINITVEFSMPTMPHTAAMPPRCRLINDAVLMITAARAKRHVDAHAPLFYDRRRLLVRL